MDYADFPFNLKTLTQAGAIEGVAAGYGNADRANDIFMPGAFGKSLQKLAADRLAPGMLLYHDAKRPIGIWESFTETGTGLLAKGRLTLSAPDGQLAYDLVKDGALAGLSVGYNIIEADADAKGIQRIFAADLFEVSLVALPCNPRAQVTAVKSASSVRDIEAILRDAGVSSRKAKVGAAAAWRAINEQPDDTAAAKSLADILRASTVKITKG